MLELGHCPGCHRHCSLKYPNCKIGKTKAAKKRRAELLGDQFDEGWDYSLGVDQPDYGQNDIGYDPEGLADPEAHNVKGPSWDIDWDL